MAKKMIDDVLELMKLTDDELTETLLNENYNKANLRELVRRTLKVTKDYKRALDYEQSKEKKETDALLELYNQCTD